MATPSASHAFVELAPHSLHIAVLSGRKVVAARAFPLEAKSEISAFVAEHGLSGAVRASLIGQNNFLHLSADSESGAVRQVAALQGHVAKLPHGFDSAPVAAVVDAASGTALDAARNTPWLLAAVDSGSLAAAQEALSGLGLSASEITVAAPSHLGVVASSLSAGEVALVVLPGENEASLAWVSADGVQSISTASAGYSKIFEAVQLGLGLKFKAAAGKLFYNENYDFSDAGAKVAETLAEALKPSLAGLATHYLHIAGLTGSQSWLTNQVASALGLKAWAPSATPILARLGLEAGVAPQSASALPLLAVAAAGSGDAPWVQPTLDVLATRPAARPKSAAPFAKNSAPVLSGAAPAATAAPRPAPRQAPPAPQPVEAVSVQENAPRAAAPAAKKSNKGPVFIAAGVGAVAVIVGIAALMRGPKTRTPGAEFANNNNQPAQTAPAQPETPAAPATPAPAAPAAPAPVVPPPAPVVVAPQVEVRTNPDQFAADPRKFGNDRYRLEVTEKGFIQALATPRDEVLVESAAGISLQGSYVGTDGRRKWFNVGGVDDAGYQATVKKSVRDGNTVFDVKVSHPRFELEQSFHCLPESVKVTAKFTPINLRDPRGVIAAVHSIRLSPVALNPSLRMRASNDAFTYAMKAGTLRVGFDNTVWSRDTSDGKQNIIAGENGVAFHFTETTDAMRNQLTYEIAMP